MNGSFNEQILVENLAKLTNSQQMIETLSHWCIFNRNKAKQVVEIWQRQFHCAPRDQRVSYLYLANDILQNSRWKGVDFIDEFWKVLPGALNDVFNNGGEIGRTTVLRLINIWEERKVFGSQGQSLKDNFLRRNTDNRNRNRNEKGITHKLKHPVGKQLEKLISGYSLVDRLPFDEDTLFGKCQAAINLVEEVEKELQIELGNFNGSEAIGKLQLQHGVLRECIDQLKVVESSRETLITYLRKALYEQESKFEQVHQQLQASQSRYEQSVNLYKHLSIGPSSSDQRREKSSASFNGLPSLIHESFSGTGSQTTQGRYTQEEPTTNNNAPFTDGNQKTAPAAVAAQLAPSTSFGYMPGHVLSYLDSDGTYGLPIKEDHPSYVLPPQPHLQPLFTPFPYPDLMNQPPMLQLPYPVTYPSSGMVPPTPPPPPPPFLPPPPPPPFLPPPPPPPPFLPTPIPPPPAATSHFMQIAAGPTTGGPFGYGPAPFPNYTVLGMHPYPSATNPYHGFEAPEGGSSLGQPPY